jgi:proline racemase
MALLHANGELRLKKPFVYESIVRSQFVGELLKETMVGSYKGVIPQISGSAFVTSKSEFFFDERDPLREGFILQ